MYPVMLPGTIKDELGITSYRNPDGLFPERQGTPPDGLGVLFVRLLELLDDGWDAIRQRRGSVTEAIPADPTSPSDPALETR